MAQNMFLRNRKSKSGTAAERSLSRRRVPDWISRNRSLTFGIQAGSGTATSRNNCARVPSDGVKYREVLPLALRGDVKTAVFRAARMAQSGEKFSQIGGSAPTKSCYLLWQSTSLRKPFPFPWQHISGALLVVRRRSCQMKTARK